jgi:hypothetical protein
VEVLIVNWIKATIKVQTFSKKFIHMFNLTDSWTLNEKPQDQGLTWSDANNRPQSRIDYVFISKDIVYPLCSMFLRRAPNVEDQRFSDHLGIRFEFNSVKNNRGKSYWKFNTSLLTDELFCKALKQHLHENKIRFDTIIDPRHKWEQLNY